MNAEGIREAIEFYEHEVKVGQESVDLHSKCQSPEIKMALPSFQKHLDYSKSALAALKTMERIKILTGYQINQSLVKLAKPGALVMHCLPAYCGKEIDEETFEANADTIFTQAENRLHVQKAILNWAVS